MSRELEELMQKSIISENVELTNIISDIVPLKENRFTSLEIETSKKEDFSIVVYKKENIITRAFKSIRLIVEKLKIMKHSQEFVLEKIRNK